MPAARTTPSGLLVPTWPVPDEVRLSGNGTHLECEVEGNERDSLFRPRTVQMRDHKAAPDDRSGLLRGFMALNGHHDRTLRFARKWGLLGLCGHSLPATHRSEHRLGLIHFALGEVDPSPAGSISRVPPRALSEEAKAWRGAAPDPWPCYPVTSEPLEEWWFWSTQAAALAAAGEILRRGEPCEAEQISQIADLLPAFLPEMGIPSPPAAGTAGKTRREILNEQRRFVVHVGQQWLEIADVTVSLAWAEPSRGQPDARPLLGYHGTGLFAALAIEVALSLTRASGVHRCDHCGITYIRLKRAVQRGRKGYCPDCEDVGPRETWRNKPGQRARDAEKARARRARRT